MHSDKSTAVDREVLAFEAALLRSVDEMHRRDFAAVHTPEQIAARRRGRPVGSTKRSPKVATTIRFDADLLATFKASGAGWQTRVNEALREWLNAHPAA